MVPADEIRARLVESPGRWAVIAQLPDEELASGCLGRIHGGDLQLGFGEWEIVVCEDKRRTRSGGAFVVWARRVDERVTGERVPAGRWVRAIRVWRHESGMTSWVESPEKPDDEGIRGMPPRIVNEGLRRELIDRLPRASSFARIDKRPMDEPTEQT